jgi:Na+/H+ antiporter NhaD/arsenite permease-like protein
MAGIGLTFFVLQLAWWPRIVRQRHEAEMREDPAKAIAAQRRRNLGKLVMVGIWLVLLIKQVYLAL